MRKKPLFIVAVTCYVLGTLSGILFQKFFPIGQLLGMDITSSLSAIRAPRLRKEVPLSVVKKLPASRVMVAIAFGQSNAANKGNVLHKAGVGVYNFHQGTLYEAQDPLLGADGDGGSVWPLLGDKLIAAGRYDAVVFVSLGVSTTAVSQWRTTGELFPRLRNALNELQKVGLAPTHFLWHQGETDCRMRTGAKVYKTNFLDMRDGLRKLGVNAPIYVCLASRCMKLPPSPSVRQGQRELIEEHSDIFAGPDTDVLGFEYRHDGCHLSDKGQQKFAQLWMEKLK